MPCSEPEEEEDVWALVEYGWLGALGAAGADVNVGSKYRTARISWQKRCEALHAYSQRQRQGDANRERSRTWCFCNPAVDVYPSPHWGRHQYCTWPVRCAARWFSRWSQFLNVRQHLSHLSICEFSGMLAWGSPKSSIVKSLIMVVRLSGTCGGSWLDCLVLDMAEL